MNASPTRRSAFGGRTRAALVVALVAILIAFAKPLAGIAFGFAEIFEPRTIALVPLTTADLESLSAMPDLSRYGVARQLLAPQSMTAPDATSAARLARYVVRVPTAPSLDVAAAHYEVIGASASRFTFEAARLREGWRGRRTPAAPLPPGFDGSTIEVDTAPAVIGMYPAAAGTARATPTEGAASGAAWIRGDDVLVAQMPLPRVASTGVSMRDLERFMTERPGVSPRVAAFFRSLADPRTVLPFPFPVDAVSAYAQPIAVNGVPGIGIGDQTGIGALVLWQRDGMLYVVGGGKTASEILAIANSLR